MSSVTYDIWIAEVQESLCSIGMLMNDWQANWQFDFAGEFKAGTEPAVVALKANRFWWHQQNKALGQDCGKDSSCWLPVGHRGDCEPED